MTSILHTAICLGHHLTTDGLHPTPEPTLRPLLFSFEPFARKLNFLEKGEFVVVLLYSGSFQGYFCGGFGRLFEVVHGVFPQRQFLLFSSPI